jgi:hypothetical protein
MPDSDPIKFREQARECLDQANKARDPLDQEAWLGLDDDFIKLAVALEQAQRSR